MAAHLSGGCSSGGRSPTSGARGVTELASTVALDARLLIVAPSGAAPAVAALRQELDGIGTLYTVVDTSSSALSADMLSDGPTHGLFNGVILAGCAAGAGPDAASAAVLTDYATKFGARTACLSAPADDAHGFGAGMSVDTRAAPLTLHYTADGAALFGTYLNTSSLDVSGVIAALGPPADSSTAPLLTDDGGNAAVAIHRFTDGREMMLLTFDQVPGALHSIQLLYGVMNWVTRGVFVGEKRAYLGPQVDDLFIGTVMNDGITFRMSGADLKNAAGWQQQVQATPIGAGVRLTFPFNGAEVTDGDDLTQAARAVGQQFFFVSHTFDHHRLDYADYARMTLELVSNDKVMQAYALGPYERTSLVTPDISGLTNPDVMRAAADFGITQLVCDTSQWLCKPPGANTGVANQLVAPVFMIPRLSTNLYATVSTPEQWVVGFNAAHGAVLGRDLTIDEILDTESNTLLGYLLSGDIDPSMFHQANLRAYAGSHTLLTDLLDRVLDKYARLRVLPVVSLTMGDIARRMQDRAALDQAGVTATVGPGQSITVRAAQAVRVPITGALASDAEHYGGVAISRIEVPAGGTITVPLAPRGGASAGSGPGDNGPSGSVKVAASAGGTNDGGCALAPSIRPWAPGRGSCCAWLAAALIVAASRPRRDRTQPRRRPGRAR